jgi:hypothetical protein
LIGVKSLWASITGVTDPVTIAVDGATKGTEHIGVVRAGIAGITYPITIAVCLIWVRDAWAVIIGNTNIIAVLITTGEREAPTGCVAELRALRARGERACVKTHRERYIISAVGEEVVVVVGGVIRGVS